MQSPLVFRYGRSWVGSPFPAAGTTKQGKANLTVTTAATVNGRLIADGKENVIITTTATVNGRLLADGKGNFTETTTLNSVGRLLADGKAGPTLNTFLNGVGEGGSSGPALAKGRTSPKRIFSPSARNPRAQLSRGQVAWWLTTPNAYHSKKWYDLVQGYVASPAGTTTAQPAWSPLRCPGGQGSLAFSAVEEYITLPSSFPTLSSYTLSLWMLWTGGGTTSSLFSQGSAGPTFGITTSTGKFTFFFSGSNHNFTGTATQNVWTHVTLVVSGGSANLYVNGVLDATTVTSAPSVQVQFIANDRTGASDNRFLGNLDDVAVWSRPLSAAEVNARYQDSRRGYARQLNREQHLVLASAGSSQNGACNLTVSTSLGALGRLIADGKENLVIGTSETASGRLLADGKSSPVITFTETARGRAVLDGKNTLSVVTTLNDVGRLIADGKSSDVVGVILTGNAGGAVPGKSNLLVTTTLTAKGRLLADGKNSLSVVFSSTDKGHLIADGKSSDTVGVFVFPVGQGGSSAQHGNALLTVGTVLTAKGRLLADGKSSGTINFVTTPSGKGVFRSPADETVVFTLTGVNSVQSTHPTRSMPLFLMATPPGIETKTAPLFIDGCHAGSSGEFRSAPLYIDGTNAVPHSMVLYLDGSPVGKVQRHMPLFIKGIGLTHSAPLYLFNNQQASSHSAPLFIQGSGTVFGAPSVAHSMPLFLARGNGSVAPLFLRGPNSQLPSSGVPLFINGVLSIASGCPLVIPEVLGVLSETATLYTSGF